MRRLQLASASLFALAMLLGTSGCGSDNRLLSDIRLSSPVIAASGKGAPVEASYTIARPASVSAYLLSELQERLYLRKDEIRPVAGNYQISLDGSYAPDPATDERRVAPSGDYRLVIEASDARAAEQASARIQIREADISAPAVNNLTLFPEVLSPNADGIDDLLKVTFSTTKTATVSTYLVAESGKRYVLERHEDEKPGEQSATWDGQIGNQLLPSGAYRFVVEAADTAGNVSIAEKPLRIDSSSMPDAHVLSVNFDPKSVMLGDLVRVTIRIRNTGNTVLRTQGPDPGYTYDSQEGFSTIQGGAFRDQKGIWRVGVDWAGAPGASGSRYPYRWGFGRDLQPGEEATVVGYIRMSHKYPRIWLHAGLVQEQVRYWDNEVGQTVIEIAY